VPVPQGGTGDTTLTAHAVLIGEGTSPVAFAGPGTISGNPLISQGVSADPVFSANVNAARPIVTQTGSNTFAITDANTWQLCNSGSATTLTVPANATIAFPVGTEIDVYQQGSGQVGIAAAVGVTINSASGNLKIVAQYTGASLKKSATNTWELVGNLTA
jgi:hypothetical protein